MVDVLAFLVSYWDKFLTVTITVLVTVGVFLVSRHKNLSYTLDVLELVSVKDDVKSDLQIIYQGNPIQSLHLIKINIMNTGFIDIKSSDFEDDLDIQFNDDSNILDVRIIEHEPDDLNVNFSIINNAVSITPLLLNRRDSFTIQSLVNNYKNLHTVSRILGIKEIKERNIKSLGNTIGLTSVLISMLFAVIIFYITEPLFLNLPFSNDINGIIALTFVLILIMYITSRLTSMLNNFFRV